MRIHQVVLFACFVAAAFGQTAAPVAEIRYDSVPNFLKLPPDLYLGEVSGVAVDSKKHVFVFSRGGTTGPAYGAAAAQLLEFGPDGRFMREIGKNLYAWSFAHAVRIDKDDNIWAIDKGSDMIIKFNPEGRVVMVFGRKKEASDDAAEPWTRVTPPPPRRGRAVPPADRRHLGCSGRHLHQRRVHQLARGEVRQERRLGEAVGRSRHQAGRVQHAAQHCLRYATATSTSPIAATAAFRYSIPTAISSAKLRSTYPCRRTPIRGWATSLVPKRAPGKAAAPWAICITPGPTQYLYSADAYPGRIYKLSLDGKVLGMLGKTGRQPKQFGWIHELACPSENEIYTAELLNWRVQKLLLHPPGDSSGSRSGQR